MFDFWELLARLGVRHECAEPEDDDGSDLPSDVAPYRSESVVAPIFTIGAWAGTSSLTNPQRDIEFAQRIGLGRIDIIVNDHSTSRTARRFDIRDAQRIATLAKMAKDAGLEVHIMSWIMPHLGYIKEAADVLFDLHEKIGFESVMWDAEEPWTLAKGGIGYDKGAELVGELFAPRDFEMGITGIRYAPTRKLKPLAQICDYWTPQNYATSTSKAAPSKVNDLGVATWTKKFGTPPRWVLGLAGYRQTGIRHHTPASAVRACLQGAEKHCDTAVFWSLNSLRRSREVHREIQGYLAIRQS